MKRRTIALLCALLPALLAAKCSSFRYDWNQRLTVVVETPNGEITRSGVIRASYEHSQGPGGAGQSWRTLAGEYPVIDLGNRRYLVAVMGAAVAPDTNEVGRTNPATDVMVFSPPNPERPYSMVDRVRGLRDAPRDKPFPPLGPPLLVTFDDPSDPLTIRRVDPDEFEDVFGPGYRLKAVTIELTDDSPTEGAMRAAFPWLVDVWRKGGSIDGTVGTSMSNPNRLADILGKGAFTMEDFDGTQ